jgi:mRNA interferase MazF
MVRRAYIPDRGDFIWVNLNPRRGHEQSGCRPALVLSPKSYNRKVGLCVICPATRSAKGYAFEAVYTQPDRTESVVLADHVRSIDWRVREISKIARVPDAVLNDVVAKLYSLIIDPS